MKKKTIAFGMALMTMVLGTNIMAFAESWKNDGKGYWWQNDDGSYPVNCWQWLDGNQDGISECIILMEMVICCRIQLHWMAIRSMETVHGW